MWVTVNGKFLWVGGGGWWHILGGWGWVAIFFWVGEGEWKFLWVGGLGGGIFWEGRGG